MTFLRLPTTGLPSAWILKQITFPPPSSYFQPRLDHYGNALAPLITLAQQEEIRVVCLMLGINPEKSVGLPAVVEAGESVVADGLTKAEQRAIETHDRQMRIEENMIGMKDKIAAYRKERKEIRNKGKSELPF